MTETTELLDRVSKNLGVPREELVRQGIDEYLRSQLRRCLAEASEIRVKYAVKTAKALEVKIRGGEAPEHPGWEDMITLENLDERASRIRSELKRG
jgi:hypothetical protein